MEHERGAFKVKDCMAGAVSKTVPELSRSRCNAEKMPAGNLANLS